MQQEIWKPIMGYETRYEVSNFGNVRSKACIIKAKNGSLYPIKQKAKTIYRNNKNGYSTVCLVLDDISSNKLLHRLVAQAFIPNPENKKCVNHKNGIKYDNRVENLEWVTHSENNSHAWGSGLIASNKNKYGYLIDEIISMSNSGMCKAEISTKLNIPYISVYRLLKSKI